MSNASFESESRPVRSTTEALAKSLIADLGSPTERSALISNGIDIITDVIRQYPKAKDIQIRTDGHIRVQLGGANALIRSFQREGSEDPFEVGRLSPSEAAGMILALWRSRSGARVDAGISLIEDDDAFLCRLGREKRCDFSAKGDTFVSGGLEVGNLRVHAFWESNGIACAARLLHDNIPSLDDLGFKSDHIEILKRGVKRSSGIILVTGKTGQGKSTTLAALAQWLLYNESQAHVLTIEDPIEYRLKDQDDKAQPLLSIRTQKEVGIEVDNFAQGVKFALRESPSVIIIGEIRDRETLDAALKVAESGHLILSTLHTDSGVGTIQRIASLYPEDERTPVMTLLSEQLILVLSQGLLRSSNPSKDKVLCYELMQNSAMNSKTAIRSFVKDGPSALGSWMLSQDNWRWDRHLDDLRSSGWISDEVHASHRHENLREDE